MRLAARIAGVVLPLALIGIAAVKYNHLSLFPGLGGFAVFAYYSPWILSGACVIVLALDLLLSEDDD